MPNFYEILGVSKLDKHEKIKFSYKKLLLQNHPDKQPNNYLKKDISKIIEAWSVLGSPKLRNIYDAVLHQQSILKERALLDNVKISDFRILYNTVTEDYNNVKKNIQADDETSDNLMSNKFLINPSYLKKSKEADTFNPCSICLNVFDDKEGVLRDIKRRDDSHISTYQNISNCMHTKNYLTKVYLEKTIDNGDEINLKNDHLYSDVLKIDDNSENKFKNSEEILRTSQVEKESSHLVDNSNDSIDLNSSYRTKSPNCVNLLLEKNYLYLNKNFLNGEINHFETDCRCGDSYVISMEEVLCKLEYLQCNTCSSCIGIHYDK